MEVGLPPLQEYFRLGPLGFPEIALIVAIALLVFGPDRLPELARQLGRAMREVRGITDTLKFDLDLEDEDEKPAAAGDPALAAAAADAVAKPVTPVDFSNLLPARPHVATADDDVPSDPELPAGASAADAAEADEAASTDEDEGVAEVGTAAEDTAIEGTGA